MEIRHDRPEPQGKLFFITAAFLGLLIASISLPAEAIQGSRAEERSSTSGSGVETTASVADTVVQPDGKIVAAGSRSWSSGDDFSYGFALARYNADGTLDRSFGEGGKVTSEFGANGNSQAAMTSLALQLSGRIIAAGRVHISEPSFILVRYNAEGSLDQSFGDGGKVITEFLAGYHSDIVVQADGKIVAAGEAKGEIGPCPPRPWSLICRPSYFALARYNTDGSLDQSFGDGGKVITEFGGHSQIARSVILQPDGKIVAAGEREWWPTENFDAEKSFALARYNTDGSLDQSFGEGGKVITDFGEAEGGNHHDYAADVVLQPDGKIVAAGERAWWPDEGGAEVNFALVRYNSDGSLDQSFGDGGKVITDFADTHSYSADLALQADGRIVAAVDVDTYPEEFVVARYNTNGSLDDSFGSNGKVTTDFGYNDRARAVVLEPTGQIIAAGHDGYHFALARYNSDGSLDTSFDYDGKVITDFGFGEHTDTDGDGVEDSADNCPGTRNPGQEDSDQDGIGDACGQTDPPPDGDGRISYIALGDSIASGEGVPEYDKYADGRNHHCHRSKHAYSRVFGNLRRQAGDKIDVKLVACSGAKIDQITTRGQDHKGDHPWQPPQMERIPPGADLVTITIGANDDLGWKWVIADCYSFPGCHWRHRNLKDKIAKLQPRLENLYSKLRELAPDGRVAVVGYPYYVPPPSQITARCTGIFSPKEAKWLRSRTLDANKVMRAAVENVNKGSVSRSPIRYVSMLDVFENHELCTREEWIHRIVASGFEGSGHPKRAGQRAMGERLHRALPALDGY